MFSNEHGSAGTVDASKARGRMDPVSLKVTVDALKARDRMNPVSLKGTVDASKARGRMDPVSLKVTKFSNKSSRDFQKIPSFPVFSFCDYHCTGCRQRRRQGILGL